MSMKYFIPSSTVDVDYFNIESIDIAKIVSDNSGYYDNFIHNESVLVAPLRSADDIAMNASIRFAPRNYSQSSALNGNISGNIAVSGNIALTMYKTTEGYTIVDDTGSGGGDSAATMYYGAGLYGPQTHQVSDYSITGVLVSSEMEGKISGISSIADYMNSLNSNHNTTVSNNFNFSGNYSGTIHPITISTNITAFEPTGTLFKIRANGRQGYKLQGAVITWPEIVEEESGVIVQHAYSRLVRFKVPYRNYQIDMQYDELKKVRNKKINEYIESSKAYFKDRCKININEDSLTASVSNSSLSGVCYDLEGTVTNVNFQNITANNESIGGGGDISSYPAFEYDFNINLNSSSTSKEIATISPAINVIGGGWYETTSQDVKSTASHSASHTIAIEIPSKI